MASTSYIRFDPATRVSLGEKKTDSGQQVWTVVGGLSYYHGPRRNECWIYVPGNFKTSGACIPNIFKPLLKPCDPGGQAAIVHSYLCSVGRIRFNGEKIMATEDQCLQIFREAMIVAKVPTWKRVILYWLAKYFRRDKAA